MAEAPLAQRIAAVRRFNRFYTQRIGVLQDGFAQSPFSLTQARVLYELLHRDRPTATEVGNALGLDAGYLSRILRGFAVRGLIAREKSPSDGRQVHLTVTPRGRKTFAPLEAHSDTEVGNMLRPLTPAEQGRLVAALQTVEELLGEGRERQKPYLLRPHRPGDMGWIVSRHGALYSEEYGWDHRLEALVAEIVAAFLRNFDPSRECCWIAERDGENLGTVMLVKESARVWSRSASASRASAAIARSRCGRTACSPPPATCTRAPASCWWTRKPTTSSARFLSARPGTSSCDRDDGSGRASRSGEGRSR